MKLFLLLNILLITSFVEVADAQIGIGEKYGSRDPRTCNEAKLSGGTKPSQETALQSFICHKEKELTLLTLVDDVKVEVAPKGRPYNPYTDAARDDIDTDVLVYPIRGSYKEYKCFKIDRKPPGKNCEMRIMQNANGSCYKSVYGDWRCGMYQNKPDQIQRDMPPPK